MKKTIFASLICLGFLAGYLSPAQALSKMETFRVTMSTIPASPTLVCAADDSYKGTTLANWNTGAGEFIMLQSGSTGFSDSTSTGTARLGPSASLCLDGPYGPYNGAVYGVALTTYPLVLDVYRFK